MINSINNLGNFAISISCFDFSTLCTTIANDKLIKVSFEIMYFCFKGGEEKLVTVGKYGGAR